MCGKFQANHFSYTDLFWRSQWYWKSPNEGYIFVKHWSSWIQTVYSCYKPGHDWAQMFFMTLPCFWRWQIYDACLKHWVLHIHSGFNNTLSRSQENILNKYECHIIQFLTHMKSVTLGWLQFGLSISVLNLIFCHSLSLWHDSLSLWHDSSPRGGRLCWKVYLVQEL